MLVVFVFGRTDGGAVCLDNGSGGGTLAVRHSCSDRQRGAGSSVSCGRVSAGGIALAGLVTAVVQLFVFLPDYKGTESVQFEDEDRYHYVRAVTESFEVLDRESTERSRRTGRSFAGEERRRMRREQHLEQEEEIERNG